MNAALRDAALRAAVFQVIEQRAKELKDQAKAELAELEPGDTVSGKWAGRTVGKATMTAGRTRIVVRDQQQLLEWVRRAHTTEITESVNPAYMATFKIVDGHVIDRCGELVEGVEAVVGGPYVSVRRDPNALSVVAEMLSAGLVKLDGLRELS